MVNGRMRESLRQSYLCQLNCVTEYYRDRGAMADQDAWSLKDDQRAETVRRVAENMASLAFTRGVEMNDSSAQELAVTVEKKAYNVARVESRTTTGVRPASESLKSYARCTASSSLQSMPNMSYTPTWCPVVMTLRLVLHCWGISRGYLHLSHTTDDCVYRNLANLILDSLKRDSAVQQAPLGEDSTTELNLFGDREFLTAETATEALGPMLAPGSAITKVACGDGYLMSAGFLAGMDDGHDVQACD